MTDAAEELKVKQFTYKWIDGDQLHVLEPVLAARGWASLNKHTCRALCTYDGDTLIGFVVLQLFPHLEPLWVSPGYRGMGIADRLAELIVGFMVESNARGYMSVADHPAAAKLCEDVGMQLVTSPVYVKIAD